MKHDTSMLKVEANTHRSQAEAFEELYQALPDTASDLHDAYRNYLVGRIISAKRIATEAERLIRAIVRANEKEGK